MEAASSFQATVYVPCHFDFSQLEYVAPFLARHGGKVFMYEWHPHKARMLRLFADLGVPTIPFTLDALMANILREERPVVFLMTASVSAAHGFGSMQHKLLSALATLLPDRVRAVSVVGHCMYGCSSCSGAQHKVPVYWTRYFHNTLGYSAVTERERFHVLSRHEAAATGKPVSVLVAPSTAETSLMCQPDIVAAMWAMQQAGTHRFVWKFHPGAFNVGEFDPTYEPHRIELANIEFIKAHMEFVEESRHVMLPYLEAFDVIVCDLHSTVAFMALYFAPKTILAYENDADYGTPDRAPEFLAALNLFDSPGGLRDLLGCVPAPRGSRDFFTSLYGHVDGTEDLRFATLAKWPTTDTPCPAPVSRDAATLLTARARLAWGRVFCDSLAQIRSDDPVEDKALSMEAIGLSRNTHLDVDALRVELAHLQQALDTPPRAHIATPPPASNQTAGNLRVLTFNLWHAGEGAGDGTSRLSDIAAVIRHTNCDVVLLQEVAGRPVAPSDSGDAGALPTRVDQTEALTALLGWPHAVKQGIVFESPGNICPHSIISRYPLERTPGGFGARLLLGDTARVAVFNTHLPYFPYQPYQLCGIPYADAPILATAAEAVASAEECRMPHTRALLADMHAAARAGHAVIVGMDANEPSPLDWTPLTALAGAHPVAVPWPCLHALLSDPLLQLRDAIREIHPRRVQSPHLAPAYTWQVGKPHATHENVGDHPDRLDFLLYSPANTLRLRNAEIVGDDASPCSHVVFAASDWPSDHRAVLATFDLL